jgi:hypothetical protein
MRKALSGPVGAANQLSATYTSTIPHAHIENLYTQRFNLVKDCSAPARRPGTLVSITRPDPI